MNKTETEKEIEAALSHVVTAAECEAAAKRAEFLEAEINKMQYELKKVLYPTIADFETTLREQK